MWILEISLIHSEHNRTVQKGKADANDFQIGQLREALGLSMCSGQKHQTLQMMF